MRAILLTPQAHRAEVIHILSISFILRWATANPNDLIYMEKERTRSIKNASWGPQGQRARTGWEDVFVRNTLCVHCSSLLLATITFFFLQGRGGSSAVNNLFGGQSLSHVVWM